MPGQHGSPLDRDNECLLSPAQRIPPSPCLILNLIARILSALSSYQVAWLALLLEEDGLSFESSVAKYMHIMQHDYSRGEASGPQGLRWANRTGCRLPDCWILGFCVGKEELSVYSADSVSKDRLASFVHYKKIKNTKAEGKSNSDHIDTNNEMHAKALYLCVRTFECSSSWLPITVISCIYFHGFGWRWNFRVVM